MSLLDVRRHILQEFVFVLHVIESCILQTK
jgi:hypothetical protein